MFFLLPLFGAAVGAVVGAVATHAAGEQDRQAAQYQRKIANDLTIKYSNLQKLYNDLDQTSKEKIKSLTYQHALDEADKDLLRVALRLQQTLITLMLDIDRKPSRVALKKFRTAIVSTNAVLSKLNEELILIPSEYYIRNMLCAREVEQLSESNNEWRNEDQIKDVATANVSFKKGITCADRGENKRALKLFSKAITLNPGFTEAYRQRGLVYRRLANYQETLKDYNQALQIDTDFAEAYNDRGNVQSELGDELESIADYTQALLIKPDFVKAYINRGNCHFELGDTKRAIEDFSWAIQVDPKCRLAYLRRSKIYHQIEDYQGAIEDLSRLIQLEPDNQEAYYYRGNLHSDLGNLSGAIKDYTQLIQLNPNSVKAHLRRGLTYSDIGTHSNAVADYTRVIQLEPNAIYAYFLRGISRDDLGDKKGAFEDLAKATSLSLEQGNITAYEQIRAMITSLSEVRK